MLPCPAGLHPARAAAVAGTAAAATVPRTSKAHRPAGEAHTPGLALLLPLKLRLALSDPANPGAPLPHLEPISAPAAPPAGSARPEPLSLLSPDPASGRFSSMQPVRGLGDPPDTSKLKPEAERDLPVGSQSEYSLGPAHIP